MPRSVLVFGNPGVGKSTLLNILLGRPEFRSGVGRGSGLTQELARAEHDGVKYFDVPGLADANKSLRKKAAEAITEALRQAGDECAVLFVLTLESGRIKPDDVVTIRAVLLASLDISSYGVIFNKVSARVKQRVDESPHTWMDMAMEIIPPNRRTNDFYYQGSVAALADQEDGRIDFRALASEFSDLRRFIMSGLQPCSIQRDNVTAVDPMSVEQLLRDYDTLRQETAMLNKQLKEQEAEAKASKRQVEELRQETAKLDEEVKRQQEATRVSEEARKREAEACREAEERLRREREERERRDREERERREREEQEKAKQSAPSQSRPTVNQAIDGLQAVANIGLLGWRFYKELHPKDSPRGHSCCHLVCHCVDPKAGGQAVDKDKGGGKEAKR